MSKNAVTSIIAERERTHGSFETYAAIMDELKDALCKGEGSDEFWDDPVLREAMWMILSKIVRIANGNARFADHWHDIQGYASLAERYLNKQQDKPV